MLFRLNLDHFGIGASSQVMFAAASAIAKHVSDFILRSPGTVRARDLRAGHENGDGLFVAAQQPALLQLGANSLIDLAARGIVGGNNQCACWCVRIASSNLSDAFLFVGNLADTALLVEESKACFGVSLGEIFDSLPQLRILLANDLVQVCRSHSSLLELLEGFTRLDGLMLARIPN